MELWSSCDASSTAVGVHELAVETWRPTGHRVVDRLRRFFVGGATELSDIAYVTRSSEFEVISSVHSTLL